MSLDPSQRSALLALAARSIERALATGARAPLERTEALAGLDRTGASFVTLRIAGELRGCCGSIESRRALVEDVWCNAYASAFSDPRFTPLTPDEYQRLDLHISVLSELQPLRVRDEEELYAILRPAIDGLVIAHGGERVTFLPSVWEQLPQPEEFIRHLKMKAGWRADFWSPKIEIWRYQVESFGAGE